jgi:hypothetical protein
VLFRSLTCRYIFATFVVAKMYQKQPKTKTAVKEVTHSCRI